MKEHPKVPCFECGSVNVTMPHPEFPENDAQCNDCGVSFGPQCPTGKETPAQLSAFVAAVPESKAYFEKNYIPRRR